MAYQADNTLISNREMLGALIARPFVAFFEYLIAMAEAGPQLKQLNMLSEKSDAELEAMGRTRQGELARIMGAHYI
ncbi:DUF1127 domain-containing protein [Yoonia sp.]|uniref:DUF1127 domain-containing protein n=1 Tax=Yoonia sp. TaxID=2212373 RepID=UPI003F6A72DF